MNSLKILNNTKLFGNYFFVCWRREKQHKNKLPVAAVLALMSY